MVDKLMPAKAHKPNDETRAEVAALASFGIPQEDIAAYIGISKPTLAKYYPEELKISSIKANGEVGKYLFSLASGQALKQGASHSECARSAMFWAKTRMGWRETNNLDHTSSDGTMTSPKTVILRGVKPDDAIGD
jgi:hypothetical protein